MKDINTEGAGAARPAWPCGLSKCQLACFSFFLSKCPGVIQSWLTFQPNREFIIQILTKKGVLNRKSQRYLLELGFSLFFWVISFGGQIFSALFCMNLISLCSGYQQKRSRSACSVSLPTSAKQWGHPCPPLQRILSVSPLHISSRLPTSVFLPFLNCCRKVFCSGGGDDLCWWQGRDY